MKQAIKKGSGTAAAINKVYAFKQKLGITGNNADKEMAWITMPPAFMEAVRLPGFPKGYVSSIIGHSNTGKSTLVNHALSESQRQGDLPVIIDTENNFDFTYAMNMGFKATPVKEKIEEEVTDTETGEVKTVKNEKIVRYDGDFIYVNSAMLADMYGQNDYSTGKERSTKRSLPVIEDVACFVNDVLDAQENGELDQNIVFVWDSVNSIGSWQGASSDKKENNMWKAGAIETAFNSIFNDRIPRSRKVGSPYTNTLILIQKVALDTSPTGIVSAKGKGGKELKYAARLQLFLGGVTGSGTKSLSAVSRGVTFTYGTETKVKVPKTQLPSPYCISSEGKFVCTAQGIIKSSEIDEYRKKNLPLILDRLNSMLKEMSSESSVSSEDIEFVENEEN